MKQLILIFILIYVSKNVSSQVNLSNGLVAYYCFSGDAKDKSGNANNGSVHGATLTYDRFGNEKSAYYFNGLNNYIDVNCNSNNFLNNYYSYSLWAKIHALPSAGNYFYLMGVGSAGGDLNFDISNNGQSVTGVIFSQYNTGSPIQSIVGNNVYPPIDTWVHYVITRDSSKIKLYINGVLNTDIMNFNGGFDDFTHGANAFYGQGIPKLTIGCRAANISQFLNADIDDLSAYNRPINYQEVLALYNDTNRCTQEVLNYSIPNIFTPNNDGVNDKFALIGEGIKNIEIQIFDRWGSKVFSGSNEWNGLGQDDGAYFYLLKIFSVDGKEENKKGFVTLLKNPK